MIKISLKNTESARTLLIPSVASHKCKGPRNTYLKETEKYLYYKDYTVLS